jgi:hypothetical protein
MLFKKFQTNNSSIPPFFCVEISRSLTFIKILCEVDTSALFSLTDEKTESPKETLAQENIES